MGEIGVFINHRNTQHFIGCKLIIIIIIIIIMDEERREKFNVQSKCRKPDKQYETNKLRDRKEDEGQADDDKGERTEVCIF